MLVKLGNLCEIKSSKRIFENEYVPVGIPFIRGQEVSDGTIFNGKDYSCFISESRYNELKASYGVPKQGDILITAVGTIGNLCYIDREFKFYYKDGNLLQFTNFSKDIDPRYLFYFMHSDYFKMQLNNNLIGAVQKALTMVMLKEIDVPLIDIKKQKEIVKILSAIDNQIERNNGMVKKLQVLGKAIFEHFAINSTNKINVKKIANVVWGQCPEGKNILIEKTNNSIPYASGAGDIDDGKLVINPKAYTDNSRRIVESKTICMSVAGTIGKIGIADDKTSIGRAMLGLYSNNRYGLICFALLKYSPILQTQATGAIQKIINNDHLDIIDIPDLSNSQIHRLNKIVDECINVEKNTQKLTILKDKILPLLINGQLE